MAKRVVRKKKRSITRPPQVNYKGRLRQFDIPDGLPSPREIREELKEYRDVLEGRLDPPMQKGVMTLMEVAEGYFSRACSIEMEILEALNTEVIDKSHPLNAVRTQEIRVFKELSKGAAELGSRRITFENLRFQQENRGLESLR